MVAQRFLVPLVGVRVPAGLPPKIFKFESGHYFTLRLVNRRD